MESLRVSSTNESTLNPNDFLIMSPLWSIVLLSIVCVTICQDLFILLILFRTRSELIKIIYVIHLANSVFCLIFKLIGFLKVLQTFIQFNWIGHTRCFLFFTLDLACFFSILAVLFFYSLYHMSSVARNPFFVQIYSLTHKVKWFIVYLIVVCGGFLSVTFIYTIQFAPVMFNSSPECARNNLHTLIPAMFCLISMPSQLAYLFAISFLVWTRVKSSNLGNHNVNMIIVFRKNMVILTKFGVFSMLIFLISSPRYLQPFLDYSYNMELSYPLKMTCDLIFLVFFSIETLILTLLHTKLRKVLIINAKFF